MKRFNALLLFAALALACDSDPSRESGTPQKRDASTGHDATVADSGPGNGDASASDAETADSGAMDSGAMDSGMADAGPPISIPDPGTAMDDWGGTVGGVCCSTPDTAYPVGIVTMNSGYVQGNIDASTLEFFYVFRAGPALTQLTWIGESNLTMVDLHDGTGLVFGAVIPGTNVQASRGTWNVNPNQIYVLHLHANAGGFF